MLFVVVVVVVVVPFREGHLDATKLLLESGAQINVPSGSNDDTPLTLACWKGHEGLVTQLIAMNSNVNHQTKTGCTPLMEATRYAGREGRGRGHAACGCCSNVGVFVSDRVWLLCVRGYS